REALLWGPDYLLQPATFVSRQAWDEAGGLDPQLLYIMDWDIFLRVAENRPAVLIQEFLPDSREHEETKTRSGKLERPCHILLFTRNKTGEELPPGSLLFLLETIQDVMQDSGLAGTTALLHAAQQELARDISERWGKGHGFPQDSDPQDISYLPV